MCLILFAIDAHPEYELIVAANRDEFYHRPTLPAHVWSHPSWMIAGKDLEGGGTWLGLDTYGRIAMLTNYRDLKNINPDAPSRGELVCDFFISRGTSSDYLSSVQEKSSLYNGFNLLCCDHSGMFYYSNYDTDVEHVSSGIHGLSNALLNDDWPKIKKGKTGLEELLQQNFTIRDLLDLLYNDAIASDHDLPETGVGLEMERMLSPMFIKSETYGSRTSSIILKDRKGKISFVERSYEPESFTWKDRMFEFRAKHP